MVSVAQRDTLQNPPFEGKYKAPRNEACSPYEGPHADALTYRRETLGKISMTHPLEWSEKICVLAIPPSY